MFSADTPFDDGPYCPETIDDTGGIGVYDGETSPGCSTGAGLGSSLPRVAGRPRRLPLGSRVNNRRAGEHS